MLEKLNGFGQFIPGIISAMFFIIVGGLAYTLRRLIVLTDTIFSRLDLAERNIATNYRDLELLRIEHERELQECHRKKLRSLRSKK